MEYINVGRRKAMQTLAATTAVSLMPGLFLEADAASGSIGASNANVGQSVMANSGSQIEIGKNDFYPSAKRRIALIIGNRNYPGNEEIQPANKNASDVERILKAYHFESTVLNNLTYTEFKSALADFKRKIEGMSDEPYFAVFYFCGHGFQWKGANYLVPIGTEFVDLDAATSKSINLIYQVVSCFNISYPGLGIAIIDACSSELNASNGLNQVAPPPGCLISYSTGAGKSSFYPTDETKNTFYTGALVDVFDKGGANANLNDLFLATAKNVFEMTKNHKIKHIRDNPQEPFIAQDYSGKFYLRTEEQVRAEIKAHEEARLKAEAEARERIEAEERLKQELAEETRLAEAAAAKMIADAEAKEKRAKEIAAEEAAALAKIDAEAKAKAAALAEEERKQAAIERELIQKKLLEEAEKKERELKEAQQKAQSQAQAEQLAYELEQAKLENAAEAKRIADERKKAEDAEAAEAKKRSQEKETAEALVQRLEQEKAQALVVAQQLEIERKAKQEADEKERLAKIERDKAETEKRIMEETKKRMEADLSDEEKLLADISNEISPKRLLKLCNKFIESHPNSSNMMTVTVRLEGARRASAAMTECDITFDLVKKLKGDAKLADDISKAMNADKDAAYRIASKYAPLTIMDRLKEVAKLSAVAENLESNGERYEQWMKYSMALGNGIAAWKLYEWYNDRNQIMEATSCRTKANQLGYTPPIELCSDRKGSC